MAKISPVSIKYRIVADFKSEGPVEKPDVIGALFGQTEGLLGSDMELRELQKEGKIGRIDVNLESVDGKTSGEIVIPSALGRAETSIIGAALETIDKIGPTDAKITIKEISDVRGGKRDYIMERAKKLLSEINGEGPEYQEIDQELRESTRTSKITEYGDEKLPAGDISDREIIVVEGRADVVNLLKHSIKNVIGMNGTKLPKGIISLGNEKELTLFVDGDRGGKLIAKNVCDNTGVAYIAVAPDGKEVEELTGKEIHQALRKKVKPEYFFKESNSRESYDRSRKTFQEDKLVEKKEQREITSEDRKVIKGLFSEIKGKNVLVLDDKLNILRNIPSSKVGFLRLSNVFALVTSHASGTLMSNAEKVGAKYVVSQTFGKIENSRVKLISI